jgi:hypothetical protein
MSSSLFALSAFGSTTSSFILGSRKSTSGIRFSLLGIYLTFRLYWERYTDTTINLGFSLLILTVRSEVCLTMSPVAL